MYTMANKEAKRNLAIFMKAGLPFTLVGMAVVFLGLYIIKRFMAGSEHVNIVLFLWLAVFWFVYQPLFKKRIRNVADNLKQS